MNGFWLAAGLMATMFELTMISGWAQQRIGPLPLSAEPVRCEAPAERPASMMDAPAALACALRRKR